MQFEIKHTVKEGWELIVDRDHYFYPTLGPTLERLKRFLKVVVQTSVESSRSIADAEAGAAELLR